MKYDEQSQKWEKAKRNATDLYVQYLEGEVENINKYLEQMQLNNPNYAFYCVTPINEIRKERLRILDKEKFKNS